MDGRGTRLSAREKSGAADGRQVDSEGDPHGGGGGFAVPECRGEAVLLDRGDDGGIQAGRDPLDHGYVLRMTHLIDDESSMAGAGGCLRSVQIGWHGIDLVEEVWRRGVCRIFPGRPLIREDGRLGGRKRTAAKKGRRYDEDEDDGLHWLNRTGLVLLLTIPALFTLRGSLRRSLRAHGLCPAG